MKQASTGGCLGFRVVVIAITIECRDLSFVKALTPMSEDVTVPTYMTTHADNAAPAKPTPPRAAPAATTPV